MPVNPSDFNFSFFTNTRCAYFPCHTGIAPEQFNCLFCYCPLYALGDRCGGNFCYTETGIKDCSHCTIPHRPGGYEYVLERFPLVAELAAKDKSENQ